MVSAFTAACSFQRLDLALVNPGTVQTTLVNDVTAAGSTAEEWSDGDLTTVRCAEKLRDWIMTKSPRIVWFCCPTENSTPSENCHLTAARSRSRHQSREHRIQRHMSNLAADMASSGQCDFVLEIPWNSRAVRFGGSIHERHAWASQRYLDQFDTLVLQQLDSVMTTNSSVLTFCHTSHSDS